MSADDDTLGLLQTAPNSLRYEFKSLDADDAGMKICSLMNRKAKVLDVGCGTGVVTEIIQNITGSDIIGIEPDVNRATKAREKGVCIYNEFLSHEFLKEHGPFDYIIFADVLEHLSNPSAMIIMAKEGLKSGGSIIASVPNVAHWFVRTDLLRGRFNYQPCGIMDATHLRWFTKRTISELFERSGFKITAMDFTVNSALPDYKSRIPWKWMRLSLRRRIVGYLVHVWPTLFGCQFIIRASLPE